MGHARADTTEHDGTRQHGRLLLTLVLLLVVAAGVVTVSTALFTDTATVTNNTVAVGTLDIAAAPVTQAYNVTDMAPGDVEFTKVTITNSGTMDLRYAMSSTTTADPNSLAAQLDFSVAAIASGDPCTNQTEYDAGAEIAAVGALGAASPGRAVFGDATTGAQAGDRTLVPAAAEGLCLRVELPLSTPSTFAGATTTVDFTYDAEQTANNP